MTSPSPHPESPGGIMTRLQAVSLLRWNMLALLLVAPARAIAQVPTQGIKVHGHWLIEVRNADGTLAVRREFKNALFPTGKTTLANLLTAQKVFDYWMIQINFG